MKFLKNTDYFLQYFTLSFGGKEAYSSKFGGFLTIITIIVFISYAIYLGQELVYLQNPFDNMTIKVDPLPMKKQFLIPTAFLIEISDGTTFSEDINSYLNIESVYHNASNTNGFFTDYTNFSVPMRFCNHTDFSPEVNSSYYDMSLDEAQCFDNHNLTLGGDFSGDYAMYLNVSITACSNKTVEKLMKETGNYSLTQCASHENIQNFLKRDDLLLALHHESLSYESSDYHTPIKKFLEEDNYIIDNGVCKSLYYLVELFEVYSESGVLISQTIQNTHYFFDSVKFDFHINNNLNSDELCLFKILFMSSKNTRIQKRSYLQLSAVIAQVGGALNAYLIIFNVLFRIVYRRKMTEKLLRRLYKDYEPRDYGKTIEIKKFMSQCKTYIKSLTPRNDHSKDEKKIENENKTVHSKMESFDILNLNRGNQKNEQKSQNLNIPDNILNAVTQPKETEIKKKDNKKENFNESQLKLTPTLSLFKSGKGETKRFRIANLKRNLFSHFIMEMCPCFLSDKLRVIKNNLKKIANFSIGYYDVLSVVKKLHEVEKLKFVLFDKKQISLFNSISQPTNPFEVNATEKNLITEKLKFDKNHQEQQKIINSVFDKPEDFLNDKISLRLMRFYLNLKESKKD